MQLSRVSRCFAALRQLRHLRRYVSATADCFRSLVLSLVHSRLGSFVLVGFLTYLQWRLQLVLDVAAPRLVFRLRRPLPHDQVTTLHWLRLPERVDFEVGDHFAMAFRVLLLRRTYISWFVSLTYLVLNTPTAHSTIPSILSTVGRRSFPVAESVLWNSLPSHVPSSPSLPVLSQRLKSFHKSFPDILPESLTALL